MEGESLLSEGTLFIRGGGSDIWGTSDQCHFTYFPMTGTQCKVEARVSLLAGPSGWTKCGVMIRESLGTGAHHASTLVTPATGVRFQYRLAPNASTADSRVSGKTAPVYLRAVRSGNRFSGWFSPNTPNMVPPVKWRCKNCAPVVWQQHEIADIIRICSMSFLYLR